GQCYSTYAGRLVADARVADGVDGAGDRLHHRSRTRLLVNVRLEVAFAQSGFFEVTVGAGHGVTTEELNRLIRPVTGQTDITPGFDVAAAAQARRRENTVDLRHIQALDRVVLVHKHRQCVDGNRYSRRLVAVLLFE